MKEIRSRISEKLCIYLKMYLSDTYWVLSLRKGTLQIKETTPLKAKHGSTSRYSIKSKNSQSMSYILLSRVINNI